MRKILSIACFLTVLLSINNQAFAGKWWETALDIASGGGYTASKRTVKAAEDVFTENDWEGAGDMLTGGTYSCAKKGDCNELVGHTDRASAGGVSTTIEAGQAAEDAFGSNDWERAGDIFTAGAYSGFKHDDWSTTVQHADHFSGGIYYAIECMRYPDIYECEDDVLFTNIGNGQDRELGLSGNYDEPMKGCELEVTDDKEALGIEKHIVRFVGPNPCLMTARVGLLTDQGGYEINPPGCEKIEKAIKDGWNDDIYFECRNQKELASCAPKELLARVASDKHLCNVGRWEKRSVQLILPQLEHVGTPRLHNGEHTANSLRRFIPLAITRDNKINMDLSKGKGKWIILSDARAIMDAFDGGGSCVGGYCKKSNSAGDTDWLKAIVEDSLFSKISTEIFLEDNFNRDKNVTILDALRKPSAGDGKFAGKLPIEITDLNVGEFAITIRGPSELGKDELKPRTELRGNAIINASAGGIVKTEGHVELVIKRSIFVAGSGNTSYDPGPTFDLSPDTTVKFIDSVLEVNPTSSSVVFLSSQTNFDISGGLTVKMKGKVDVAPIVIRDDMGIASALDRMVGLKVEYTADQKKTTYVAPVKFLNKGSKSELVFECTSDTIEGCSEEVGTDDLLVVRDGDAPKFYIMDIGFVVDFVDSIPLHLYAASGEMVGTRILFSSGVQSDDGGEATSEEDIDDSDEGGKNAKPKDRDEVDLDFEGEYKDKGECPSGEYWSQNFGQCIPLPSKKSSSGVHDILKGDDGKGEPDGEYELITPTDSDIDQPIFNKEGSSDASGGGCSMIGHSDGTQNILLIIMPLLAVLFISLYRRSNGYSV